MKLKKIAALALAGVMAVSMLAGCATNKPTDEPTEPTTTDVSAAVAAAATTASGISFEKSADLEKVLSDYMLKKGTDGVSNMADPAALAGANVGFKYQTMEQAAQQNYVSTADVEKKMESWSKEAVGYYVTKATASEDAAVKALADDIKTMVDGINDDYIDTQVLHDTANDTYYRTTFTVTGEVGVYAYTDSMGLTTYYAVYTITRTGNSVKM